jgi:hypothetical protein
VRTVGQVKLLGHWLDEQLRLEQQTKVIKTKLQQAGRQVATAMTDAGFGTPFMGAQYASRIEGKALVGVEILASAGEGFPRVMERLNAAQIDVARNFLGLPLGTHVGSRVAMLAETRLLTRSGTTAAVKVVMARARLACLPEAHPAAVAVAGALMGGHGDTWIEHSRGVMTEVLGVTCEFCDFEAEMTVMRRDPVRRKHALRAYRQKVVMPRARVREIAWFQEKLADLNKEGIVNYAEIVPLRTPWRASLKWASWGPCMWRFFKAWCVARATGGVPLEVWGHGGVPKVMAKCPACKGVLVGLRHVIQGCPSTEVYRRSLPDEVGAGTLQWALVGCGDVDILRQRVRFFGLCVAKMVHEAAMVGRGGAGED